MAKKETIFPLLAAIKTEARRLQTQAKARGDNLIYGHALDQASRAHGYKDWNTASAMAKSDSVCPVGEIYEEWLASKLQITIPAISPLKDNTNNLSAMAKMDIKTFGKITDDHEWLFHPAASLDTILCTGVPAIDSALSKLDQPGILIKPNHGGAIRYMTDAFKTLSMDNIHIPKNEVAEFLNKLPDDDIIMLAKAAVPLRKIVSRGHQAYSTETIQKLSMVHEEASKRGIEYSVTPANDNDVDGHKKLAKNVYIKAGKHVGAFTPGGKSLPVDLNALHIKKSFRK